MAKENSTFRFDPPDRALLHLLGELPPQRRICLMLDARQLAVGLIRGRLHRRYPELSPSALNLKVLEELERA